jgi:autophagy-related protein 13
MSETKRAMTGHIPAPGRPLVVEISLKTAEGDSLVLEWWRLAVVAGGDPMVRLS